MQSTWKKTLATFRRHSKRRGLVRLELKVPQEDAALLRRVVGALADPAREAAARALLRERFDPVEAEGLKALLSSAPLDGIELTRERDAPLQAV